MNAPGSGSAQLETPVGGSEKLKGRAPGQGVEVRPYIELQGLAEAPGAGGSNSWASKSPEEGVEVRPPIELKGLGEAPEVGASNEETLLASDDAGSGGVQISQFEVAEKTLVLAIRDEVGKNSLHIRTLREVGDVVLRCLWIIRCKLWPTAGGSPDMLLGGTLAGTQHGSPDLEGWVSASGMALNHLSGGVEPMDSGLFSTCPRKKVLREQLQRFEIWDEVHSSLLFDDFFRVEGLTIQARRSRLRKELFGKRWSIRFRKG